MASMFRLGDFALWMIGLAGDLLVDGTQLIQGKAWPQPVFINNLGIVWQLRRVSLGQ